MTTQMTQEQMAAEIARLRAENDTLVKDKTLKGGLKVSTKGALSLYGLQRFPITLYKKQWLALLAKSEEIKSFIMANDAMLQDGKQ